MNKLIYPSVSLIFLSIFFFLFSSGSCTCKRYMSVSPCQRRLLFYDWVSLSGRVPLQQQNQRRDLGEPLIFRPNPGQVFPDCSLLLAAPLLPPTSTSRSVKLMKCPIIMIVTAHYVFFSDLCFLFIQPTLGVNKSSSALLYVILSPVGPYFKTGTFSPVALLADPSFVRAWPGGCGDCKLGG